MTFSAPQTIFSNKSGILFTYDLSINRNNHIKFSDENSNKISSNARLRETNFINTFASNHQINDINSLKSPPPTLHTLRKSLSLTSIPISKFKTDSIHNHDLNLKLKGENNPAGMKNISLDEDWLDNDAIPGEPNQIIVNGLFNSKLNETEIEKIELVGHDGGADHQELLVTLSDDSQIRISRNNGTDTIEILKNTSFVNHLPVISTHQPNQNFKVCDLLNAFYKTHDDMPEYEQGNCQIFAKSIYNLISPKSFSFDLDGFI